MALIQSKQIEYPLTGSFIDDGSGLTAISASSIVGLVNTNTGSFATTGSNVFRGNQTISGSLLLTGSISSSAGAYFTDEITVTHMTIGHGLTKNNTNLAMGWFTMPVHASGLRNTIVGASSGQFLQSGSDNTVFGNSALVALVSGSFNTAIGQNAGFFASGSGNVFIGHQAGQLQTSGDNKLWISNTGTLTPLIKGDFGTGLLQFNTAEGTQITGSFSVSGSSSTFINDIFLIKDRTTQQPVLTVTQSIVQFATQSSIPTGTTNAGSIWFTSSSLYVGLE